MNPAARESFYSVPLRRTRWVSFWVGVAAVFVALMLAAAPAAALVGLVTWLEVELDGMWVILLFGLLWFGLFFLSYPLQRRCARSRDLRRPGISLMDGVLFVPVTEDSMLRFKLDEPHELMFGWYEHVMTSAGGATKNSRAVWTHAVLSQAGQGVYLIAEDAVREAQSAGWPKRTVSAAPAMPRVSLWASDLVALLEVIRKRAVKTATERRPAPATDPRMGADYAS